jgi:hypothetical protein
VKKMKRCSCMLVWCVRAKRAQRRARENLAAEAGCERERKDEPERISGRSGLRARAQRRAREIQLRQKRVACASAKTSPREPAAAESGLRWGRTRAP